MRFEYIDLTEKKLHLKRWLGCGTTLIRKPSLLQEEHFRKEGKEPIALEYRDYSEVVYHFFTLFFLPIWPVGCYRVGTFFRQEQSFEVLVYKKVIKDEEWDGKEIARIYVHYWLILAIVILFFVGITKCGGDYEYD